MTNRYNALRFAALLTCLGLPLVARTGIIPSPAGSNTEYHVEVGFTYASGVENIANQLVKNFRFQSASFIPIGPKVSGYAKLENGIGFGVGIGPCSFIEVRDHNHSYDYNDDRKTSYIIPFVADIRYYFPKTGAFAPYIRAGIAYPISSGDHIGASTPAPVVALGANVWEHRIVAIGIEAGYDASEVEVKSGPFHAAEKIRPTEFTLSVFAAF